eukprot:6180982-Pleurochrysis_carterae.AAC.3
MATMAPSSVRAYCVGAWSKSAHFTGSHKPSQAAATSVLHSLTMSATAKTTKVFKKPTPELGPKAIFYRACTLIRPLPSGTCVQYLLRAYSSTRRVAHSPHPASIPVVGWHSPALIHCMYGEGDDLVDAWPLLSSEHMAREGCVSRFCAEHSKPQHKKTCKVGS